MAYKKSRMSRSRARRSKKFFKRTFRRGRQVRNRTSVPVGLGFPKRVVMTHKYHENIALASASGTVGNYLFSCNGMFDPNYTSTGHQPMYFDQMTAVYNHYTVIGSRIIVKFTTSGSLNSPTRIVLWKNDDATVTPTTLDALLENSQGYSYKQIPPSNNSSFTLRSKWSAKKTFGGSVLANDNLQGNIASNPPEQTFYNLSIQSNDEGTSNTITCDVFIQYIAVWEELRDIAQS